MRTSISKKLLAGALSVMMVLSLVAPTGAQAASKYSVTKKATITADKTNTFTIKGVKKGQYVKMTKKHAGVVVKYGSKTVTKKLKIKGTGKNLKVKVTAPDSVASYKTNITLKVFSKKNKVVKTLRINSTVKVTELKVVSVEPTSTTGQFLTAYFNKSLATLQAADIDIRKKATNEVKGVKAVSLSSNGKSANIELVGDGKAGDIFVEKNTDYVFTVTQNNVSASTTFRVDDVLDNCTVTKTDATKKTITVGGMTLSVPAGISVDYEEILGTTVTVWYNESAQITKLVNLDKKVVYGAFRMEKDTATKSACFVDLATGDKYYTQDTAPEGSTKVFATNKIDRGTAAGTLARETYYGYSEVRNNEEYAYAKLIFNPTGTVREVEVVATMASFLVKEVKDNTIVNGASKQSLKDYSIVKDGKTVDITAIQKDDVVFYNSTAKFAEIYTNKQTGKLEAVYAGKFAFGGKTYEEGAAKTDAFGQLTGVGDDYMNALLKGGKDINVYFARTGKVAFVTGEMGAVETTDKTIYVTEPAAVYVEKGLETVKVKGYNPETKKIETYSFAIEELESIVNAHRGDTDAWGYAIGSKPLVYSADDRDFIEGTAGTVVKTFDGESVSNSLNIDGKFLVNGTGAKVDLMGTATVGAAVTLTSDKNGKIIGYKSDSIDANITKLNGTAVSAGDLKKLDEAKTIAAKCAINATTELAGQMTASTTIIFINKDEHTAVAETLGTLTQKILSDTGLDAFAWINSKKVVDTIVLVGDNTNFDSNAEEGPAFNGVVVSFTSNTDGTVKEMTAYVQNELKTFTEFGEKTKNKTFEVGSVVTITPNKKGDKILGLNAGNAWNNKGAVTDFKAAGSFKVDGHDYILAKAVTPTIVKIEKGLAGVKEVKPYTFAELENCIYKVNVYDYMDGVAEIIEVTDELVQSTTPANTDSTRMAVTVDATDTTSRKDKTLVAGEPIALTFAVKAGELLDELDVYVNGVKLTTGITGNKVASKTYNDGDELKFIANYASGEKEEVNGYVAESRKATSATFTVTGSAIDVNTINTASTIGSMTFKDQFNKAFTTAGATVAISDITLGGSAVPAGATTILAAGNATAANPSVIKLTTGSTAGYTLASGDKFTATVTDTASGNKFAVTLTYTTAWAASDVTATLQ